MNVKKKSVRRNGYKKKFNVLLGPNCITISFRILSKMGMYFSNSRLHNFGTKLKLKRLWYGSSQSRILSYSYTKFQINPFIFDILNECLKLPYFGEIQHRERDQKCFLSVCKAIGVSVICGTLVLSSAMT